jgi:hypothetical protein
MPSQIFLIRLLRNEHTVAIGSIHLKWWFSNISHLQLTFLNSAQLPYHLTKVIIFLLLLIENFWAFHWLLVMSMLFCMVRIQQLQMCIPLPSRSNRASRCKNDACWKYFRHQDRWGRDIGEWVRRWIQLWYIWYIIRTFVNATMHPILHNKGKRKNLHSSGEDGSCL